MKKIFILIIILMLSDLFLYSDETTDTKKKDTPALEGEELVIVDNFSATPQKTNTITKEEIERYNSKDLTDLLQNVLNLSVSQNGGYGTQSSLSIRGNSSSEVLVLINGIPVNSSQSGTVDLSTIPINSIKKIEVTYGGSDTKYNYSGAMGGIINIITEEKRKPGLYANLDVSNLFYYPDYFFVGNDLKTKYFPDTRDFFDTQKILSNFGIGNNIFYWDQSIGADIAENHYLYKDSYDVMRQMNKNEVWDVNCKNSFSFNLPDYMRLVFSNTYYYADKNIHGSMYNTNYGKQLENQSLSYITFNADKVGTDKIDTQLSVSHKFDNLKWKDLLSDDTHNLNTIMATNKWDFLPLDWLLIQPGWDFSYDFIDSTAIGQKYLFNGGGYITTEFSILKIAKIITSVKINYDKNFINVVPVIPKFGVVFFIGNYFTVKSNFYRTFRNPTFNDLYWPKVSFAEGNPDLKPEVGIGGDLSLSYTKKGILSAQSTVYINYIQDAIKWFPDASSVWHPSNVGKAYYFGLENTVKSDFSKYVELNLSYNFLLTYVLTNDFTFVSDQRMPYQPMHTFGFGVTIKWNPGKEYYGNINFTGHYESERYIDLPNTSAYLQPFFTLNVSLNQSFCKYFTFYLTIKDVFNSHYFLVDQYPEPAGSVTIGIKINYETKFKKKKGEENEEN